ncbi:MAG: hypothetical protein IPL65_04635 [Lewinellaceae bacterium]|nr:hypothetical protein [Lewinellaceae bacterium]
MSVTTAEQSVQITGNSKGRKGIAYVDRNIRREVNQEWFGNIPHRHLVVQVAVLPGLSVTVSVTVLLPDWQPKIKVMTEVNVMD